MFVIGNKEHSDSVFFLVNDDRSEMLHWFDGMKILYILSGTARVQVERTSYFLQEEDMLVINPFEPHSIIISPESNFIELCVPYFLIQSAMGDNKFCQFDCNTVLYMPEQELYLSSIRQTYADVFRMIYKGRSDNTAYILSSIFGLIDILSTHFKRNNADSPSGGQKNSTLTRDILSYINQNFRSEISIHDVAQANFVTSNYLSRYFQRSLNTTFTDYLTSVRLSSAYRELLHTSKTITQLALDNGFRSTNAFIKYFKNYYGETPGKLRKRIDENQSKETVQHTPENGNIFHALLKYISSSSDGSASLDLIYQNICINASHRGPLLRHQWKNLLNIGYAKEGLTAQVQTQLRKIQTEIGFHYARFHGLFDDDMLVYSEDIHGNPVLDFSLIDLLFDFLLSIDLKPYIELGFIPSLIAKPNTRAFRRYSYLGLPADSNKWMFLIRGFITHLEQRYGVKELQSWYFTPMSINCIVPNGYGTAQDYEDYFHFYQAIYYFLKKRNPHYRVTGPGIYSFAIHEDYYNHFLHCCAEENCLPDQLTILCFPYEEIHDKNYFHIISSPDLPFPDALSSDEQYVSHLIDSVRSMTTQYNIPEIAIIEWNSTMWQRDLCNDSCFKSSYLVKNIAENYDRIWGMGYWTVNEMLEETAPSSLDFHGGYGWFTAKSIPKSSYFSMKMLNQLGNQFLYRGNNCIATRKGDSIQILLYHYCHYDELYRNNYLLDPSPLHCYERFVEKGNLHLTIKLSGLGSGMRRIRKYQLGRSSGSSFDNWMKIGMPAPINQEEREYLISVSQPAYYITHMPMEESFSLTCELSPHDVQLILIDSSLQ